MMPVERLVPNRTCSRHVNFLMKVMQAPWLLLLLLLPINSGLATKTVEDDQSLLWGTYRPNLYFGLKPRLPQSLMTGLIWFGTHDFQSVSSMWFTTDTIFSVGKRKSVQNPDTPASRETSWRAMNGHHSMNAKEASK